MLYRNRVKTVAMAIMAIFVLMFGSPEDALAAKSGGRASGSFRGSAPTRTFSGGGGSSRVSSFGQSSGGGTVILAPSPSPIVVSPFGYSPFGLSPFGLFRPVIMGPSLSDIIIIGGVAYVGYSLYKAIGDQKLGITDGGRRSWPAHACARRVHFRNRASPRGVGLATKGGVGRLD